MANQVPPVPYASPVTDQNGLITQPWAQWFRQLFERVGGFTALSNAELAPQSTVTTIQSNISTQGITLNSLEAEIQDLKQGTVL